MAGQPLFTVGHSTRSGEEFTALLQASAVEVIVDVRKLAGSRRYPWFDEDALAVELPAAGIDYRRLESLGGRRPVSRDVPFEVNALWQNRSFHNYADHALSHEFGAGLMTLLGWAGETRTSVMCSEAVWWRCHRRIIADWALARDVEVVHLLEPGKQDRARLTEGGVVHPDATVTYPALQPRL